MEPFFGFTIVGIMMLSVVLVSAFSALDILGFSSSEKSITKEVEAGRRWDNPKMCMNFDDPQFCVSNIPYMKRDPGICNSLLEDKQQQYECLSKFFRKF